MTSAVRAKIPQYKLIVKKLTGKKLTGKKLTLKTSSCEQSADLLQETSKWEEELMVDDVCSLS
jgi:hypothetical protein